MTKFLLYKESASQQICIGPVTDFTVLKAVLGSMKDFWEQRFYSQRYLIKRALQNFKFSQTNSVFFS